MDGWSFSTDQKIEGAGNDILPAGDFDLVVSSWKRTDDKKAGVDQIILTFNVIGGQYKGKTFLQFLKLFHPIGSQERAFGEQILQGIMKAVGVQKLNSVSEIELITNKIFTATNKPKNDFNNLSNFRAKQAGPTNFGAPTGSAPPAGMTPGLGTAPIGGDGASTPNPFGNPFGQTPSVN